MTTIPKEHEKEFAGFPAVLRDLVLAELAAGNGIAEFSHGFPAAPCGAYIRLEREVTTRPREDCGELSFYDRNGSSYSGEFTDRVRHFFVLEPPHPPEPEPDMDAIREDMARRVAESDARRMIEMAMNPEETRDLSRRIGENNFPCPRPSALLRFAASLKISYDDWKEGTGYDLAILNEATPAEREQIEQLLVPRCMEDWRDVEALAALGTPGARAALRHAFVHGSPAIRMAVHTRAPELITPEERTDSIVRAIAEAESFAGLTETLREVEACHPQPVIDALWRGVIERDGGTAVHLAAMLTFLHGKADSPFDWEQRPLFLKFHTKDPAIRRTVAKELCGHLNVDPSVIPG